MCLSIRWRIHHEIRDPCWWNWYTNRILDRTVSSCNLVGSSNVIDNGVNIRVEFESVSINTPIQTICAHIGSSTSIEDREIFAPLFASFNLLDHRIQATELLHHFASLINADAEEREGGGTELIMTLTEIVFRKDSISGAPLGLIRARTIRDLTDDRYWTWLSWRAYKEKMPT